MAADPTPTDTGRCPGPLVWFDVDAKPGEAAAAVLECGTCGYVTATGNILDDRHTQTALLRSPS